MRDHRTLNFATFLAVVGLLSLASQAWAHPGYGCSSCHVPHAAAGDNTEVPLWNPEHTETTLLANATYVNTGGTLQATLTGPDGASKLCLSCHDGSYDHVTSAHAFGEGLRGGVDAYGMGSLANTHPISFDYGDVLAAGDTEFKAEADLPAGALDGRGRVQCTSCHDVHNTAADVGTADFANLRWQYVGGYGTTVRFCNNCHAK